MLKIVPKNKNKTNDVLKSVLGTLQYKESILDGKLFSNPLEGP